MNADLIARNTKACENGHFCEEYARRMIPGLEWVGGKYDALLNGVPLDVKGCEAWVFRAERVSKRRAGRVTLGRDQKRELEENNGLYFCVVHIGELIIDSFLVPAVKVPEVEQVTWTTMQKLAEVV